MTAYLVKQKPHAQAKPSQEFIHHCPSAGRCSATSREAGIVTWNGFLGGQTPSLWTSPLAPPLPQLLLLGMTSHGVGHPFGQCGSAVLALCPPSSWGTPSLPTGRAAQGGGEVSALCRHCSAATEKWVSYHHCFHQKSNTTSCEPLRRKLTLSQLKLRQLRRLLIC